MDFSKITRAAGKVVLTLKKVSPEIMLIGGVVGIVGATVLACKATLKAKDIVEDTHDMIDDAQEDALERDLPEKYRKREIFKIYIHQTGKMLRIYGPAIALGTLSLGLIVGSHCVLNRRYIGTAAACKAIEEAFKSYRAKVRNIIGEEDEKLLYLGGEKEVDIKVRDKETNAIITEHNGVIINPDYSSSPYAKFFDESSPEWKKNPEYNRMFLECQQKYANNLLNARGHLFLNEVYDMLGIPRTQAGAVVGWLKYDPDNPDNDGYVDFGIFNAFNEKARDFVNGYERSILLDFNVDGLIYDKI